MILNMTIFYSFLTILCYSLIRLMNLCCNLMMILRMSFCYSLNLTNFLCSSFLSSFLSHMRMNFRMTNFCCSRNVRLLQQNFGWKQKRQAFCN